MNNVAGGSSKLLKTNVANLIHIFRNSLVALIPYLEQAHIPWREPDSYDEWDEIAQVLYKNIVIQSIKWSLSDHQVESLLVPDYGMSYENYSMMSFVEVISGSPYMLFHRFTTTVDPLDTVMCRRVDTQGNLLKGEFEFVPIAQTHFQLQYRVSKAKLRQIQELQILL